MAKNRVELVYDNGVYRVLWISKRGNYSAVDKEKAYKSFSGAYNAWMKAPKSQRRTWNNRNWTPEQWKKLTRGAGFDVSKW